MSASRRRSGLPRRGLLAGAAATLAACAATPRPPLRELYRPTAATPEQPPLIVIPGGFGSRLRDTTTGHEIWPGSTTKLLFSRYLDLEVTIDAETLEPRRAGIVADDVFAGSGGRDYYGRLLGTLERAGGFRRRYPGERPEPRQRNYYVYAYDWRGEIVDATRGLHELIERLRDDYADPRLAVDVVAHSNGGLLARYYARYGVANLSGDCALPAANCAGAGAIRRLVLVGTPNLGTVQAALSHIRGEELGLGRIDQEVVATCSGVTQTLPNEALPWLLDVRGENVGHSVFSADTWRELGWSVFDPVVRERAVARHGGGARGRAYLTVLERYFERSLGRGLAFTRALSAPSPQGDVAPYVFGADCDPTLARLVVERVRRRHVAREHPRDVAAAVPHVDYAAVMFQPGDRVVTRQSLLGRCRSVDGVRCAGPEDLRIEHSVFLCEQHQSLAGNPSFQNNLLYTLLSA